MTPQQPALEPTALAEIAGELYALSPGTFTARRDERAREAKAAGDAALAGAVKRLPKPSLAAWAVNVLVRHDADQVTQVLDLGESLREAQASMSGEALRDLGRQRRTLVAAVTRQARSLAADLGHRLSQTVADRVEDTLHAAMVDEQAAAAVRSGLLVRHLAATGVDDVDVAAVLAVPGLLGVVAAPASSPPPAPQRPALRVVEDDSRAVDEAETAVQGARRDVETAEARLAKAEAQVDRRQARALQLQAELDELRRRLAEVEQAIEAHDDELAEAEELRDERRAALEEARDGAGVAQERLERLLSARERRSAGS